MNKCPKCGQEAESKFCPNCGINISEPPKCPKCGAVATSPFCPECGCDMQKPPKNSNKFVEKTKSIFNKCKEFFLSHMKQCIIVATASILAIVLAIILIVNLTNIFKTSRVSKIELGMDVSEVIDILGENTSENEDGDIFYWYEKKIAKKMAKADKDVEDAMMGDDEEKLEEALEKYDEIYSKLEEKPYKFIMIRFSGDKVVEIFFDKNHVYEFENDYATEEKIVKELDLGLDSLDGYTITTEGKTDVKITSRAGAIEYSVKFEDGSYYSTFTSQQIMKISVNGSSCDLTWKDAITEYSATKPLNINGEIVDGVLNSWTSSAEEIILPDGITDIGTIFQGNTTMKKITLPTDITEIKAKAFKDCTALQSIKIPAKVTKIGESAFENCSSMSSITVGSGVAEIGNNAFYNCSQLYEVVNLSDLEFEKGSNTYGDIARCALVIHSTLISDSSLEKDENEFIYLVYRDSAILVKYEGSATEIVIPGTYNGKPCTVAEGVFKGKELTKITLSEGITIIGENAFFDAPVKSVILPSSLLSIGNYAFSSCNSLESITIPENVVSIGKNAFSGCNALKSLVIPNSTTSIGEDAFAECSALESVTIPEKLTKIENGVFRKCSSLKSINIPNNIITVGDNAFSGCSSATSLNFGTGLTTIGSNSFGNCSSLTTLIIPETITNIGSQAFDGCSKIEKINFNAINCEYNGGVSPFLNCGIDGTGITLTIGKKVTKLLPTFTNQGTNSSISAKIKTLVFEEGSVCEEIGSNVFQNCDFLETVNIPESIKAIGAGAFGNCDTIKEINFNAIEMNDLELKSSSGYDYSFKYVDCIFLNSGNNGTGITVNIGKNVKKIPDYLFCPQFNTSWEGENVPTGSINITAINFAENCVCESIGENAFYGTKIKNITIPESITAIKSGAFNYCSSLEKINFNAISAKSEASIYIFEGVSYERYGEIFEYAGSEKGIVLTIGKNVTKIPKYLFSSALLSIYEGTTYSTNSSSFIKSVIFEENSSCKTIEEYAFKACTRLGSITLPDSVTTLGEGAFNECINLAKVNVGNGVQTIKKFTFTRCYALASLTIGTNVSNIETGAFGYNYTEWDTVYNDGCVNLVEIYNLSPYISVTTGTSGKDQGTLGYYAKVVHTSATSTSIIDIVDDYVFMTYGGNYYLMGYVGLDSTLTHPENYKGNSYTVYEHAFHEETYYGA